MMRREGVQGDSGGGGGYLNGLCDFCCETFSSGRLDGMVPAFEPRWNSFGRQWYGVRFDLHTWALQYGFRNYWTVHLRL